MGNDQMTMKKILFTIMILVATTALTSCDYYDKVEDISAGMFYESFWSSRPKGSSEVPYYTMKFSGTCHCRLRHYITEDVDVDIKAYYSIEDNPRNENKYYSITDFKQDFAHFEVLNYNTLTLWVDGETYIMYKQY